MVVLEISRNRFSIEKKGHSDRIVTFSEFSSNLQPVRQTYEFSGTVYTKIVSLLTLLFVTVVSVRLAVRLIAKNVTVTIQLQKILLVLKGDTEMCTCFNQGKYKTDLEYSTICLHFS